MRYTLPIPDDTLITPIHFGTLSLCLMYLTDHTCDIPEIYHIDTQVTLKLKLDTWNCPVIIVLSLVT